MDDMFSSTSQVIRRDSRASFCERDEDPLKEENEKIETKKRIFLVKNKSIFHFIAVCRLMNYWLHCRLRQDQK